MERPWSTTNPPRLVAAASSAAAAREVRPPPHSGTLPSVRHVGLQEAPIGAVDERRGIAQLFLVLLQRARSDGVRGAVAAVEVHEHLFEELVVDVPVAGDEFAGEQPAA